MLGKLVIAMLAVSALVTGAAACSATRGSTKPAFATNNALAYYPLFQGWGWAYQVERDGGTILMTYPVIERRDDLALVGNGDDRIEYAIVDAGIARRDKGTAGDFLLRAPVTVGAQWPVTDGTAKVIERQASVNLPSGKYDDCVVVEEVRRDPNRVSRTTYCRGTGPVEIEMRVWSPIRQAYETIVHARLLAVTRPDDK